MNSHFSLSFLIGGDLTIEIPFVNTTKDPGLLRFQIKQAIFRSALSLDLLPNGLEAEWSRVGLSC